MDGHKLTISINNFRQSAATAKIIYTKKQNILGMNEMRGETHIHARKAQIDINASKTVQRKQEARNKITNAYRFGRQPT